MIIGLTGQMQVGKDTVADYLVENYGFKKVGFAEKMYEAVCGLMGITEDEALRWKHEDKKVVVVDGQFPYTTVKQPITWRGFLQRFGTDMGRDVFGEDFWVDQLINRLPKYQEWITELSYNTYVDGNYVIRDVRFNNEAKAIKLLSGTIWKILRAGYEGDSHRSEAGIDQNFCDVKISNNSTLDDLFKSVDRIMTDARVNA